MKKMFLAVVGMVMGLGLALNAGAVEYRALMVDTNGDPALPKGWQLKATNIVGVTTVFDVKKQFGATGIGIVDDTAQIQAAMNAAAAAGGGAVYIPSGKYRVQSLVLPSTFTTQSQVQNNTNRVRIFGDGESSILDGSWHSNPIFMYDAGTNWPAGKGITGLEMDHLYLYKFSNVTNVNSAPMVWIYNTNSSPALTDCVPIGWAKFTDLFFYGGGYQWACSNVTCVAVSFEQCHFLNYELGGVLDSHMDNETFQDCFWSSDKTSLTLATNSYAIRKIRSGNLVNRNDSGVGLKVANCEVNGLCLYGDLLNGTTVENMDVEWSTGGIDANYSQAFCFSNICQVTLLNVYLNLGGTSINKYILCQAGGGKALTVIDPGIAANFELPNKPVLFYIDDSASLGLNVVCPNYIAPNSQGFLLAPLANNCTNLLYWNGTTLTGYYLPGNARQQIFKGLGREALAAQSGNSTYGSFCIGANFNSEEITTSTRKWAEILAPKFDSGVREQVTLLAYDASSATSKVLRFGGDAIGNQFDVNSVQIVTSSGASSAGKGATWIFDSTDNLNGTGYCAPTNGFLNQTRTVAAADATMTGQDGFVLLGANHSATLPSAATNFGKIFRVLNTGSGTNAILTVSAQTINGGTKWTNTAQYKFTGLLSDGANWWVVEQN